MSVTYDAAMVSSAAGCLPNTCFRDDSHCAMCGCCGPTACHAAFAAHTADEQLRLQLTLVSARAPEQCVACGASAPAAKLSVLDTAVVQAYTNLELASDTLCCAGMDAAPTFTCQRMLTW